MSEKEVIELVKDLKSDAVRSQMYDDEVLPNFRKLYRDKVLSNLGI